jgi:starvation-inducible outer membrane lipoprotein
MKVERYRFDYSVSSLVAVLACLSLFLGVSCSVTLPKALNTVQAASSEAFEAVSPKLYSMCEDEARKGLGSVEYLDCDAKRHKVYSAFKLMQQAIQSFGEIYPTIEELSK